jgi:aldose 1-epimerase
MRQPVHPSGEQVELVCGDQAAVVVEVGGALRDYRVAGEPLLDGYPVGEMCSGARGQPLIPWPNRIRDGRYQFDGASLQLALTEPQRRNAIHGLVRWANWTVAERAADRVVMSYRLHPMPGYPFALDCAVEYTLGDRGLTVRTSATNIGDTRCPYGTGAHPYLTVGTATIDEATLTAPGRRYLPTDEQGIPTGVADVAGTDYDFRGGRPLGGARLDHSFTELERDGEGRAWVELRAEPAGRSVRLWVDGGYPYLELFTGDSLPERDRRRQGLGVEPMTCAPDAFRSGAGLLVLQPGETVTTAWGIVSGG